MKTMSKKQIILKQAKDLLKTNPEATIDDLIDLFEDHFTDEEIFEAIQGTEYSTLINSRGDN